MLTGCAGAIPYVVAFGLLRDGHNLVLARRQGMMVALKAVSMPRALYAGGTLVYTVLSSVPSEVVIQTPNGTPISRERYAGLGSERCPSKENGGAIGSIG
jgi:hypothetical protein